MFTLVIRFYAEEWLIIKYASHHGGEEIKLHPDGSSIPDTPPLRFNAMRALQNEQYPACAKLDQILGSVRYDEINQQFNEKEYQLQLDEQLMHCGNERVYGKWGYLDKKHFSSWKGCVPEIIAAKRRMFHWIQDVCAIQMKFNINMKATENRTALLKKSRVKKGVIYTGKTSHFKDIYQSIRALRNPPLFDNGASQREKDNSNLPAEVWVNARDMGICESIFHNTIKAEAGSEALKLGTTCRALPDKVAGFTSKFYALLGTSFTDVVFIDADNIAVGNLHDVFDSEAYQKTGAVIWPDLWGDECYLERGNEAMGGYGYTSFESHVLWRAKIGGLEWKPVRNIAQEAEAGQVALNLTRHATLLEMGRRMIEDELFYKKIFNGDKDIFRFIFLIMGEPFHFVSRFPGYSTNLNKGRDCITQYFDSPRAAVSTTRTRRLDGATTTPSSSSSGDEGNDKYKDDKKDKKYFAPTTAGHTSNIVSSEQTVDISSSDDFFMSLGSTIGYVLSFAWILPSREGGNPHNQIHADGMKMENILWGRINELKRREKEGIEPVGEIPMFFHQLKQRSSKAFQYAYRVPKELENEASVCLELDLDGSSSTMARHPGHPIDYVRKPVVGKNGKVDRLVLKVEGIQHGKKLSEWADALFREVDEHWTAGNVDSMISKFERWEMINDMVKEAFSAPMVILFLILLTIISALYLYIVRRGSKTDIESVGSSETSKKSSTTDSTIVSQTNVHSLHRRTEPRATHKI